MASASSWAVSASIRLRPASASRISALSVPEVKRCQTSVVPAGRMDSQASAQDLDPSVITVGTPQATAQRGAVLGAIAASGSSSANAR